MKTVNQLIFILILFFAVKILIFILKKVISSTTSTNLSNKLSYGLVSRKDLINLPDSIFINWCITLLEKMEFKNIHILSLSLLDNVQIMAYKNKKKIYVKCILCELANPKEEDNFTKVGMPELRKLIGTMEHDNIKYGYVITNGDFGQDAVKYTDTLPAGTFFLKLIDGCELTHLHRQFQKQYACAELNVEVE